MARSQRSLNQRFEKKGEKNITCVPERESGVQIQAYKSLMKAGEGGCAARAEVLLKVISEEIR